MPPRLPRRPFLPPPAATLLLTLAYLATASGVVLFIVRSAAFLAEVVRVSEGLWNAPGP